MKNEKNLSLRKKTHNNVDRIMDKAESIGENTRDKIDYLKEKSLAVNNGIKGYIQENPEKSILIAAGAGIAVGAILANVMMKRKQPVIN